jgi:transposase
MTDIQLYEQLLGITPPWSVATVEVDPQRRQVLVRVEPAPDASWCCPECERPCPGYDEREERRWRHLDSCEFQTWLLASLPRVHCPEHGVKTVTAPWAGPYSRFTTAFACFAQRVLRATQVQSQAATLLRLTVDEVHYLMVRVVAAGLERRAAQAETAPEVLSQLTLDEKHYGQGQSYLTVLGDPQGARVWEVADERTSEATQKLLETSLVPAQRAGVQAISLDLWQGFLDACGKVLPEAEPVYDRFHAAQELSQAVEQTRREEHRRLRQERQPGSQRQHGNSPLTGTRWWWLKRSETLEAAQREYLEQCLAAGLETARVWECKEAFRKFFEQADAAAAQRYFEGWYARAVAVENRHLTEVAERFKKHLPKLLAAVRRGMSNAFGEYLNSAIQTVIAKARGFRQFSGYRRAILFFLGKLDRCPQTFP